MWKKMIHLTEEALKTNKVFPAAGEALKANKVYQAAEEELITKQVLPMEEIAPNKMSAGAREMVKE